MAIEDNVGASDQISLILNGKKVEEKPKLICPKCGADRFVEPCRREGYLDCPIREVAQ